MNTDSGNRPKVFTLRQNGCSHKTRTGVHFKSESVFTLGQNTHRGAGISQHQPLGPSGQRGIDRQKYCATAAQKLHRGRSRRCRTLQRPFLTAKRHPNLPPRSLDAYHPLHFHETTSFSNHPVNRSSGMSEKRLSRTGIHEKNECPI